jgi:periplasmic protein TonB
MGFYSHKREPNRLLHGFVALSLAIHVFIFMHIAGIYRSNALSFIELTLQDMSKPSVRSIPRPRHRPKAPEPMDVKRLKITQRLIPSFKPMKIEPAEKDLPDSLVEGISTPDIAGTPGLNVADWSPEGLETSSSYLEMVRLKIERHKEYPHTAKTRQIEGSVTIRFVITPDGGVRTVEIVKPSRHMVLDTAALKAVKDAAPFPRPPKHLFKGEIPLELTIVFELT